MPEIPAPAIEARPRSTAFRWRLPIDSPRQSLWGQLVNYSPSIIVLAFTGTWVFVAIPAIVSSSWPWSYGAYAHILSIIFIASVILLVFWNLWKGNFRQRASWSKLCSRVCCVLFLAVALFLPSWFFTFALDTHRELNGDIGGDPDPDMEPEDTLFLIFFEACYIFGSFCVLLVIVYSCYLHYSGNRCRRHMRRLEEERFGTPVFVSMPIFKLCGHFAMVIGDWKYDMRLDGPAHTPSFHSRQLSDGEWETSREALGYYCAIAGWTRFSHEELEARFQTVLDEFGLYNRFSNNCRHFLHNASSRVLNVVYADGNIQLGSALNNAFLYLLVLLVVTQIEDFLCFMWMCIFGPDWDNNEPVNVESHFSRTVSSPSMDWNATPLYRQQLELSPLSPRDADAVAAALPLIQEGLGEPPLPASPRYNQARNHENNISADEPFFYIEPV